MGTVAKAQQQARSRARARRVELDAERAAKDERIELGAAAVYLGSAQRDDALAAVERAEQVMAAGLRTLLAEGVSVQRAAALCELRVAEVRRLQRSGPADGAVDEPTDR